MAEGRNDEGGVGVLVFLFLFCSMVSEGSFVDESGVECSGATAMLDAGRVSVYL